LKLADAIVSLFSDPSYAQKLAMEGRKRVQEEFTWEKAARKTVRLYEQLLRAKD
jgi:glycosyltransferase involved in cell wall biosynthesis